MEGLREALVAAREKELGVVTEDAPMCSTPRPMPDLGGLSLADLDVLVARVREQAYQRGRSDGRGHAWDECRLHTEGVVRAETLRAETRAVCATLDWLAGEIPAQIDGYCTVLDGSCTVRDSVLSLLARARTEAGVDGVHGERKLARDEEQAW